MLLLVISCKQKNENEPSTEEVVAPTEVKKVDSIVVDSLAKVDDEATKSENHIIPAELAGKYYNITQSESELTFTFDDKGGVTVGAEGEVCKGTYKIDGGVVNMQFEKENRCLYKSDFKWTALKDKAFSLKDEDDNIWKKD